MAQQTDAALKNAANIIGNETVEGANTADRVRNILVDMIDSKPNNSSYIVRHIGDYDISVNFFPSTGGTLPTGAPGQGNRWITTAASTTLQDTNGDVIPSKAFIEAKVDNPSTINASDWFISYTV